VNNDETVDDVIARCVEKSKNPDLQPIFREYNPEGEKPKEKYNHLKQIGVSSLYQDCSFDTYTGNAKLVGDLLKISGEGGSVVLRGSTGCGKTHLSVAMIKGIYEARFITVPDLLLKIRSSFNGGKLTEEEIIDEYSEVKTLVLDDLGAEKTSEFAITTLYIILDRRLRERRQTIITTNLNQD
jgi:DNA replication protein DnaC